MKKSTLSMAPMVLMAQPEMIVGAAISVPIAAIAANAHKRKCSRAECRQIYEIVPPTACYYRWDGCGCGKKPRDSSLKIGICSKDRTNNNSDDEKYTLSA